MSAISRFADWDARLSAYLDAVRDKPFAWGENDCALFAAGAVEAMTGVDLAANFRGLYGERHGAAVLLREVGAGRLVTTVAAMLPERPIGFARRGDLAWNGQAIGVVIGSDALFVSDDGLTRVPRALWKKAFAV